MIKCWMSAQKHNCIFMILLTYYKKKKKAELIYGE